MSRLTYRISETLKSPLRALARRTSPMLKTGSIMFTQPLRRTLPALKTELRAHKTLVFMFFTFCLGFGFTFLATSRMSLLSAKAITDFNPGLIISDEVMSDYTSMSLSEIQSFLTSKNSCNNTDYSSYEYYTNKYPDLSWHWSGSEYNGHFVCLSEERFGDGVEIGTGQTAAEIIYAAAHEYQINPQALLVLLEKEQSLITDDFPNDRQYRAATGYGCPDTAACDSRFYGFKNQIFRAAELFRYTLDNGSIAYPEHERGVYVAYNPTRSCGGTDVYIESRATAALYRYTPYQPNPAALAAGSGTGDACSSYGNRNFYLYFTKWFGDPTYTSPAPVVGPLGEQTVVLQWQSLDTPRYLTASIGSAMVDTKNNLDLSSITKETIFFSTKTFLPDGRMCLLPEDDNTGVCYIYNDLSEYDLPRYPLETPRNFVINGKATVIRPATRETVSTLKLYQQIYFKEKLLLDDGSWCLIYNDTQNTCVRLSELTELDQGWLLMERPRTMVLEQAGYKINALTGQLDKSVYLFVGMERKYVSKKLIENDWCLRTEYDHDLDTNNCIKWSNLRDI